ncbi:hypothetical protein [Nocardia cerradoensis]|nr:hypothetical protein [Nocardia cerradoensis]
MIGSSQVARLDAQIIGRGDSGGFDSGVQGGSVDDVGAARRAHVRR